MSNTGIICRRIPALAVCIALFAILLFPGILIQAHAQGAPSAVWMRSDGAGTVTFSSDGQTVADAGGGIFINLRNATSGALIRSIRTKSGINSIDFSPNGALLAAGRTNGSSFNLNLFRVSDGVLVM